MRKAEAVNDERCDRDREAAQSVARSHGMCGELVGDNRLCALRPGHQECHGGEDHKTPDRDRVTAILTEPWADIERKWLARCLLEALDTIDKARELLNEGEAVRALRVLRQTLNGGNDATP